MRGGVVLVSDTPLPGHGLEAERLKHRIGLLGRHGGGAVLAPAGDAEPFVVPGVRHIALDVAPGLPWDARERAVADQAATHLDAIRPRLVHCQGVRAAIQALMRRRTGLRVVLEPGVTPAQRLRDEEPKTPPTRLQELVELEDKTLRMADAVVARSPVEAATLAKRGVAPDKLWTVRDGPPPVEDPGPLPDLPHVIYVGDLGPWSGWATLLEALSRLARPWRLTVVVPREVSTGVVEHQARALEISDRVNFADLDADTGERVRASQIVVHPALDTRVVLAGSLAPEGAMWAIAGERPLIASDLPSIRAYVGPAAHYVAPGDAGEIAKALAKLLAEADSREALAAASAAQRPNLNWDAADAVLSDLWSIVSG